MPPFERVVDQHGPMVWRVCRSMLPPADADDAWSDTFLAALRGYPGLRPDSNVAGWLATIAHRKCLDIHRRRRRAPAALAAMDDIAVEAPDPLGPDDALHAALGALSQQQRTAVVLHHVGGVPHAEVATYLGISAAAARRSAADGMAKLRTTYRKDDR